MPATPAIHVTRDSAASMAAVDSPFGPIHVAADDRAVVRVELWTTPEVFSDAVARRFGGPVSTMADASARRRGLLDRIADELAAYFEGSATPFTVPLALRGSSEWDQRVLEAVRRVPYGRVSSYGRIATIIGARGAARAVGGAVGRNPIALVIPCHRVIAGDGSLGGYGGSWSGDRGELLDLKRTLLALEGVLVPVGDLTAGVPPCRVRAV